jgi:hypothetical protein
MDSKSLYKYVRSFQYSLAIVSVLYLAVVAATALAVNHSHALRLDQRHISRIWLPTAYAPDSGYEVQADVVLRDLNSGLLYSRAGARILDTFVVFWVMTLSMQLGLRFARVREAKVRAASRTARQASMHAALPKVAPYGGSFSRRGGAKVLQFRR